MEKCEGLRGGNVCGRKAEFYIGALDDKDTSSFSCPDCVGRIMIEKDIDEAKVERLYA